MRLDLCPFLASESALPRDRDGAAHVFSVSLYARCSDNGLIPCFDSCISSVTSAGAELGHDAAIISIEGTTHSTSPVPAIASAASPLTVVKSDAAANPRVYVHNLGMLTHLNFENNIILPICIALPAAAHSIKFQVVARIL